MLVALLFAVAVVALPAAGCGGSSANDASSTSTTSTTAGGATSFADCLKENGVENFDLSKLGARGGLPKGVDQAALQKAKQACGNLVPQGRLPQGAPSAGGGNFQAFVRCMKRHGVELPGAGSTARPVDTTSAKHAKAQKACASLLGATR